MTNGTKNIIKNESDNINALDKFWELNKIAKYQNQYNCVRTQEEMIDYARLAIDMELILPDNKYYNFVDKFATGEVKFNSYGRKLYVKLGEGGYIKKQIGDDGLRVVKIEDNHKNETLSTELRDLIYVLHQLEYDENDIKLGVDYYFENQTEPLNELIAGSIKLIRSEKSKQVYSPSDFLDTNESDEAEDKQNETSLQSQTC